MLYYLVSVHTRKERYCQLVIADSIDSAFGEVLDYTAYADLPSGRYIVACLEGRTDPFVIVKS
jgi:hypothetical protein